MPQVPIELPPPPPTREWGEMAQLIRNELNLSNLKFYRKIFQFR